MLYNKLNNRLNKIYRNNNELIEDIKKIDKALEIRDEYYYIYVSDEKEMVRLKLNHEREA